MVKMFFAFDAFKRQSLLNFIEKEFSELESKDRHKYCLWNCPECERILISGGKFGYTKNMKKDEAICIGSYAHHKPPIWFRHKDEKYDLSLFARHYLQEDDFHLPVDMDVQEISLTREEYINTFEYDY